MIMYIILMLHILLQANDSSLQIERNPFQPVSPEVVPTPPAREQQISPSDIPDASGFLNRAGISQPVIPVILDDLRAIVMASRGEKMAMFGDQIVTEKETLVGYTVISISLDKVTLKKGDTIIHRTIDPLQPKKKIRRPPPTMPWLSSSPNQTTSNGMNENMARLSELSDKIEYYQSFLNPILDKFLDMGGSEPNEQ